MSLEEAMSRVFACKNLTVDSPTHSMDSDTAAIIWRVLHLKGPALAMSEEDSRSAWAAWLCELFSSPVEESMAKLWPFDSSKSNGWYKRLLLLSRGNSQ